MKRFTVAAILIACALLAWFAPKGTATPSGIRLGTNPDLPTLTFYTSGLATTPQLPLWHAAAKGDLLSHCNLEVKVWKTLDDLRGTILAGKGDLWLGHTEGFVQAGMRGAPVKLLAVTAWRKFYLVSTDETRLHVKDYLGSELAYAPTGSPAVPVLRSSLDGAESIRFKPGEARQIAMLLMKGELTAAVVPEPMVSMLEMKVEGLKVGESVEALYGKTHGGEPRMPIAGLAIHASVLEDHPGLAEHILASLKTSGRVLAEHPEAGIACLPKEFSSFVKPKIIAASLKRDKVLVKSAREVKGEIDAFLKTVMKEKHPTERELEACLF